MCQIIQGMDMPTGAEGRRTMMFSATFPISIQRLAADFLFEPVHVTVGKVGAASANVTQIVMNVEDDMKPKVLCDQLTSNPGRTLIFVETKRNADMLEFALQDRKFPATSIHGDRTQQERESALDGFKNGESLSSLLLFVAPFLCSLVTHRSKEDNMPLILNIKGRSTPVMMLTLHSRVNNNRSFARSTRHTKATATSNTSNRNVCEQHELDAWWLCVVCRQDTNSRGHQCSGARSRHFGCDPRDKF
jgi:hypothetical protein